MKQTELKRKVGLHRKTPLARKKPVDLMAVLVKAIDRSNSKRSTMRPKKPAVASAQAKQRRELRERSGGLCEMEVPSRFPELAIPWVRCGLKAVDPAHVYTRPKCGSARDHVDAVIHACRGCHDASKGKLGTEFTRVPLKRAQAAWDVIRAHSKLGDDVHVGSVGPRPEKGHGFYV